MFGYIVNFKSTVLFDDFHSELDLNGKKLNYGKPQLPLMEPFHHRYTIELHICGQFAELI